MMISCRLLMRRFSLIVGEGKFNFPPASRKLLQAGVHLQVYNQERPLKTCGTDLELKSIKQIIVTEPANSQATGALILLHGSGDNGKCFRRTIRHILGDKSVLPHIRIIYPTAPLTPYSPAGGLPVNQWYDVSNYSMNAKENENDLARIGKDLVAIINSQVKCGIPKNRIAVAGFSRGGAMSFHMGYQYMPDIAAVGVMSSWIPYSSNVYKTLRARSPGRRLPVILQQHGADDDLVAISNGQTSFDELKKLGVQGKFVAIPGLGHEVQKQELLELFSFVTDVIPDTPNSKS